MKRDNSTRMLRGIELAELRPYWTGRSLVRTCGDSFFKATDNENIDFASTQRKSHGKQINKSDCFATSWVHKNLYIYLH